MTIASVPTKYGFRIRTRSGVVVENLLISGRDREEAERKLRQVYVGCEILEVRQQGEMVRRELGPSYEDVVDLIADQESGSQGRSPLQRQ